MTAGCSATAPLSDGGGGGGGGGGGVVTDVQIKDFVFTPFTVTVRVGGTVRWTNQGAVPHTTTSDDGIWDSGTLSPPAAGSTKGGAFQHTFDQPGTYRYHCTLHPPARYPGFVGTVVVTQ